MRSSHPTYATDTAFDEQHLLPEAGVVPLLALAERAGLRRLLTDRLSVADGRGAGHDSASKITTIVAGMAAGADSIEDLGVLRHGATATVFTGIKAPSTIGTHLRAYTFVTSASWTPSPAASCWACTAPPACWTHWQYQGRPPTSTSMTPSRRCTATPSRASPSATHTSRA